MILETKYEFGQTLWACVPTPGMPVGTIWRAASFVVQKVEVFKPDNQPQSIIYGTLESSTCIWAAEDNVFLSKEEAQQASDELNASNLATLEEMVKEQSQTNP